MTEEKADAYRQRLYYAKESAKQLFKELGFEIINSDNQIFCFIASMGGIAERKIKVVVDEITDKDIELIKKIPILPSQTKEIWCRPYGSREWQKIIFNHRNQVIEPISS